MLHTHTLSLYRSGIYASLATALFLCVAKEKEWTHLRGADDLDQLLVKGIVDLDLVLLQGKDEGLAVGEGAWGLGPGDAAASDGPHVIHEHSHNARHKENLCGKWKK